METSTGIQRDQQIPLTVATIQDNLKLKNMLSTGDDGTNRNVNRTKLALVIPKAENDHMANIANKKYDKLFEKNEENKRLLGPSGAQKKIVIVPSTHAGTLVSTNGVKQHSMSSAKNGDRFTVTPSTYQTKTDESKYHRYMRAPQFLEIPGLEGTIRAGHTLPLTMSSLRSLKLEDADGHQQIISPAGANWTSSYCFSEVASHMSVRSLASIGMGSTDGRKVTIRRVPTSPTELFNIVHSPT